MKGIVAAEKELGLLQNQLMSRIINDSPEKGFPTECRRELKFLKKKYELMERLLELSNMRCQTTHQKKEAENLRQECSLFKNSILADFEDRYNQYADSFESMDFLSDSSSDRPRKPFHHLLQEWNDLQKEHRRLELKLLNAFISKYPVTIF